MLNGLVQESTGAWIETEPTEAEIIEFLVARLYGGVD